MWGRGFGPSSYNPYVGKTEVKPIADFTKLKDFFKQRKAEEEMGDELAKGNYEGAAKIYAQNNPVPFYQSLEKIKQAREASDLEHERQKELKVLDAQLAAQNASSNPFGGKNEFVSLLAIRNSPKWKELTPEDQGFITNRLNYLSNNPDAVYSKAYAGQSGKEQATAEFERAANNYASGQRVRKLQDVLAEVEGMDRIMFTPIGATKAKIGQIGDAFGASNLGGMTEEQRSQRSAIDTAIRDIGQDLIAKAKSKGQAGINTLAEIERIVGNLSMTKGRAELVGALRQLMEQEQKLNALETIATPMPTGKNPTDNDPIGIR